MEKWETVSSQLIFDRLRVRIVEDIVRLPGGEETKYLVLRSGPGVAVLAVTDDRRVVLTREYRHPVGQVIFDLPGGGMKRGESLEEAALRELREEAGLEAKRLEQLGSFFPSPARASTVVHVFLARDLTPVPRNLDPFEDIEVHFVPWTEALAMAERQEIREATLIYALFMAQRVLGAG